MADNILSSTSLWQNRKCLFLCCLVSMANMQYGFDLAAVGSLQAMPGFLKVFGHPDPGSDTGYAIDTRNKNTNLTSPLPQTQSTVQQLITSLLTLGSFISSLVAGLFSTYLGRKPALWLACIVNAIACGIQIGTSTPGVLYLGRLLLGFANGFLVTFSNIYTAEVAPAHMRGVMVALFAYWVNIGSIMGAVVDNKTKERLDELSYRIPLACLYVVPTLLFVALFFVPESPRWLLHRGKEGEARRALEQLRGESYKRILVERGNGSGDEGSGSVVPTLLEVEWVEMIKGVDEEKREQGSVSALDMFRGPDLRRTLLCYGMIGCQTASGVWFLIGYQTYFFTVCGIIKAFEFSIMNTCFGFLGVNVGMYAISELLGRRSILMLGAVACGLCQLATAIAATVSPNTLPTGQTLVAFTALFMFFYNGCVGAASYPVATELGARYGYIWAASNLCCVVFFYFFMPEMKGRSLEELDEIFAARVPARKFNSYQTVIRVAARIEAANAKDASQRLEKA
ncbi:uncharacterized protein N7473_003129 [Penicillium subrubescens]|uniref:uncharacterized protein n=1 Tax=Penicillium subrubescens TaxID=1316194 RepID=UPI00254570C5|nr:uncharacterized protein N7473_003129 [Penicillium subrubescens]KAJ5906213.1 hypothetical protein N7473_003129 [Penicillium subrubescens]